jgi:hypothetical protein
VVNFRSMVLAATERDHGEKFLMVARPGPSLPAAIDVNINSIVSIYI